jgi:hypothetical protein
MALNDGSPLRARKDRLMRKPSRANARALETVFDSGCSRKKTRGLSVTLRACGPKRNRIIMS